MLLLALALSAPAPVQLPVTDGLDCWLRADAGVTATGGVVEQWADQSGNGLVFTPPATNRRPSLTPGVTAGLPGITFDGSHQLDGDSTEAYSAATVFALARYTVANSNNDYLYAIGNSGSSGSQFTLSRRNGNVPYHFDGSVQNIENDETIPTGEFQVFTQVYGGGAPERHELLRNNFELMDTTANSPYSVDASRFVIGNWSSGSVRFVGDLVEFVVFDRALDADERFQVEEYLRQRAGLPEFFNPLTERMTDWQVVQYEVGAQPDADWQLRLSNRAVDQFVNCDPSMFLAPYDPGPATFTGGLGSGDAPDYMGFVFGFQDRGSFYLFDWKKQTASFSSFGVGNAGMSLRRFTVPGGGDPTGAEFWGSLDTANVATLADNSIPWVDGVDYEFTIRHEPPNISVEIREGTTVLETWNVVDAALRTGPFGYYVNSLQNVRFGRVLVEPSSDIGSAYCDAGANSASAGGAALRATGSASVAANDLVLESMPTPPGQAGIFIYSDTRTVNPAGDLLGEGRLCVAGSIVRAPSIVVADALGRLTGPIDSAIPPNSGFLLPGATLHFQSWFRDPFAGDLNGDGNASGFNLSNGLTITFVP
ncbi:MAG: hypothetical protein AAFR54_00705 [Planctomycetota bacterium]